MHPMVSQSSFKLAFQNFEMLKMPTLQNEILCFNQRSDRYYLDISRSKMWEQFIP